MKKIIRNLSIILLFAIFSMQISCSIPIDLDLPFSASWQKDLNKELKETCGYIKKIQYRQYREVVSKKMFIYVSEDFGQNDKKEFSEKILKTILSHFEADGKDFKEVMRESRETTIMTTIIIYIKYPDGYRSNLRQDPDKDYWTHDLWTDTGVCLVEFEKIDLNN